MRGRPALPGQEADRIACAPETGRFAPVPRIEIKKDGLFIVFNRKLHCEDFVQRFSDELKAFKQTDEHRRIRAKYLGIEE